MQFRMLMKTEWLVRAAFVPNTDRRRGMMWLERRHVAGCSVTSIDYVLLLSLRFACAEVLAYQITLNIRLQPVIGSLDVECLIGNGAVVQRLWTPHWCTTSVRIPGRPSAPI